MWLRTLRASFSFSKISPRCFSMFICSARVIGCLVYSIYKRNVPPWSAGLATRSVVGFVGAKVRLFPGLTKHFEEKWLFGGTFYVFFAVFSVVAAVPSPTVASASPPIPTGTAWTDIRSNNLLPLSLCNYACLTVAWTRKMILYRWRLSYAFDLHFFLSTPSMPQHVIFLLLSFAH